MDYIVTPPRLSNYDLWITLVTPRAWGYNHGPHVVTPNLSRDHSYATSVDLYYNAALVIGMSSMGC
jgi:hypothetical protein